MSAARAPEAEEPRVFLAHARFPLPGGVDVPDRDVAAVPQRVIRQAVLPEVVADVAVRPVGQGVQLPASVAQLQETDARARAGMARAQPGPSGSPPQFPEPALPGPRPAP